MAGVDIQAKVRKGLAKAVTKTGDGDNLVELKVITGANDDPISPDDGTESWVELPDCILKSVVASMVDETLVRLGDVSFVANGDNEITTSDVIRRGGVEYIVQTVDVKSPAGTPLAYMGTARPQ